MDYDCNACGACCAYAPDWPTLTTERDRGPDGPPEDWVEDGHVRWADGQCAALEGTVGSCTSCQIYSRRPQPCRGCEPGSTSCLVARRHHGLAVPEDDNDLEALFAGGGARLDLG